MGHDESGSGLDFRDLLSIGTFVAVDLLVGLGLGWWADAAFEMTPVLTLLGLAAGIAAGIAGTWVRVRPLLSQDGTSGERASHHDEREPL